MKLSTYRNILTKLIPYINNYKKDNVYKQIVRILENLSTKIVHTKDQIWVIEWKYKHMDLVMNICDQIIHKQDQGPMQ